MAQDNEWGLLVIVYGLAMRMLWQVWNGYVRIVCGIEMMPLSISFWGSYYKVIRFGGGKKEDSIVVKIKCNAEVSC